MFPPIQPVLAAGGVPPFMAEVATLVVAGAVIAYVSHRLGLVPIVGFLIAGVVIGPNALGLVDDRELVDAAAELGVILLLFTIGVEFSLERLAAIKGLIFGGGGLQVALATAVTAGLLALFGVPWRAGVFTGFMVALSSTAIVLKLLGDRSESNSEHGRVGLGLLIFQDLAVIVMALVVPMLGGGGGSAASAALALGKAGLLIALVLVVARRLMPPLLEVVARTCSPELFLLTVIAVCLGTAYLTSLAGVSLSLGAFLAGLVVSESRFSEHALSEVLPLEILFNALFFVSVGMLLDLGFLASNFLPVLAVIAVVLAVKVATTGVSVLALGYPAPVAAAAALMLAQVGEFSFVLERSGRDVGLTPAAMGDSGSQVFIAATVVLMVLTPLLTSLGVRLGSRVEGHKARAAAAEPEALPEHLPQLDNHVIVAGYGQAARRLVRVLQAARVPYVITTLSPGGAEEAEREALPVLRGDATRQRTLLLAGAGRAKMLVNADDDPATARRVVAVARLANPEMRILVRTRYIAEIGPLLEAGADQVVAEELESVVQLFADVLRHYEVAAEEIERHEQEVRSGGYALLLEPARGATIDCSFGSRCKVDTDKVVELRPKVDASACSHLDEIRPVLPSARGCEDCLRTGDDWVHLRVCMTCGHVGCCDSSKNRHATAHYRESAHPIVKSAEPDEDWGWCYVDEATL
jgi:CPA2 family monovalent cation:H+ antiporter-2